MGGKSEWSSIVKHGESGVLNKGHLMSAGVGDDVYLLVLVSSNMALSHTPLATLLSFSLTHTHSHCIPLHLVCRERVKVD